MERVAIDPELELHVGHPGEDAGIEGLDAARIDADRKATSARSSEVRKRLDELAADAESQALFDAIDKAGNKVPITPAIPESDEELRRFEDAGERRRHRLEMKARTTNQA